MEAGAFGGRGERESMTIIFLLEERSMKELLDILLPQILPKEVLFKTIPHSGKSDLQRSIPHKLKAWNTPDTKFVVVQDQDSANCVELKKKLEKIVLQAKREVLIRIVCRELESWYFGDLNAVSNAYKKDVRYLASKKKYRTPDQMVNPKEELRKLFPKHQQLDGARRIGVHMKIEENTSESFRCFVKGVRKLCTDSEGKMSNINL